MKKNLLIPALVLLSALNFYSCKKDGSNSTGSSAVSELTASQWKFQNYQYLKDGTWIADDLDPNDPNNFTINFNSDNTFSDHSFLDGSTITGTWHFSSNNTVITTTGGDLDMVPATYTVTILNATTLQLTNLTYPHDSGQRINFTH